jgi:hypothetical protein
MLELGSVTQVFALESEGGAENHQLGVRLHGSGLELPQVPVVVGRPGFSVLPRVGDLVAIGFVGGDLNAPVALGALYSDAAHPPQAAPAELVYQPPDEADASVRRVYVELPSGTKLTWNDDTLTLESGGTEIVVARVSGLAVKLEGSASAKVSGAQLTLAGMTQFSSS